MTDRLQLFLQDRIEDVADAAEQVADFAGRHGADASAQFNLRLAVDELLTNVISYGFPDRDPGDIHIQLTARCDDGRLDIRLDDTGRPFNPFELPTPDTEAPLDSRQVGGLGIHFVRSLMHEVAYRREHGHNITLLRYDL
jgi:serine/threonine-protein kinase RsbW